jgi:filamentous hemagglutinin family protein
VTPARIQVWAIGVCVGLAGHGAVAAGPAGVKLDGTLGGSAVALAGPAYNITQNLGTLAGGNLFFSFQYFNIATGQTALFTTTSPGIGNVISRVTGGYASTIDGTISLQAASGAPNFFFINPSGVTFTANAVIDVPAAFYVTTANYLKFPDGNFYSDPTRTSTLSMAAPEAFGFLGSTRAPVNLAGAGLYSGAAGTAPVQIVAGDVTIDGGGIGAGIATTSGDLRVIATGAQATEVPLTGPYTSNDGSVTIQNGGQLVTGGGPTSTAGSIYVSAATLQIDGESGNPRTGIFSEAGGDGAGPVTVNVSGSASLANGGNIISLPGYGAPGADIELTAGSLTISSPSPSWLTGIVASTGTTANGGSVLVNVTGAATIDNGGQILSETYASGRSGDVTLIAGSLNLQGGPSNAVTQIANISQANSSGAAGQVSILTTGATSIVDGAGILSVTEGTGNSGPVIVTADSLTMDGGPEELATAISSSALKGSSGEAAHVFVNTAGAMTISNNALISSTTDGVGNAGDVTVNAGSLSIYGGPANTAAGITTSALTDASGSSGKLSVTTTGATTISSGGEILSATGGTGNAGDVSVTSGSLAINGAGSTAFTGISSSAVNAQSGNSGQVTVSTSGATTLTNGGAILSATDALGDGGNITVTAGSLTVVGNTSGAFTGISSSAISSTSGNSGQVSVTTTGAITLSDGGSIVSATDAPGNAGNVTVNAASLSIDGGSPTVTTAISSIAGAGSSGNAGQISVNTNGAVTISSGGEIVSDTYASGHAGDVILSSGSLSISGGSSTSTIETGILSSADKGSSGNAGHVTVTTGTLSIDGGTSSALAGISSRANAGSSGNAGQVSVTTSGATTISNGGEILSSTHGQGNAGDVTLMADSLAIDGGTASVLTGISSSAAAGSNGNAGQVSVTTTGATTLVNGGEILSTTTGPGNAGQVSLTAGSLDIDTGAGTFASEISSSAVTGSGGNAGQVTVVTGGATTLFDGGQITSETAAVGHAGDVTVATGSLMIVGDSPTFLTGISSRADAGSSGNAGQVSVTTGGATTISNGGEILSSSQSSGNAGRVTLTTGSLSIDGGTASALENTLTGISSSASINSTGSAGVVTVDVGGTASVTNAGEIGSTALTTSDGQPGTITIHAGTLILGSYGVITIENEGTAANPSLIQPTQIYIQAQNIWMNNGGITAKSIGNVAASAINVHYGQSLYMDPSGISTTSVQGNGGPITIIGQGPMWIGQSAIATSVSGTNGNGGDIRIDVPYIVLSSGVIQANTTAPLASGGDITIDALALIPSFQSYELGGSLVQFIPAIVNTAGLNVVQAAAPDGVSGTLSVTVPTLDLGNSLLGLTGAPAAPTPLGRGLCSFRQGSSLSIAGRGGLPESARDPLWIDTGDEAGNEPERDAAAQAPVAVDDVPGTMAVIACR